MILLSVGKQKDRFKDDENYVLEKRRKLSTKKVTK